MPETVWKTQQAQPQTNNSFKLKAPKKKQTNTWNGFEKHSRVPQEHKGDKSKITPQTPKKNKGDKKQTDTLGGGASSWVLANCHPRSS